MESSSVALRCVSRLCVLTAAVNQCVLIKTVWAAASVFVLQCKWLLTTWPALWRRDALAGFALLTFLHNLLTSWHLTSAQLDYTWRQRSRDIIYHQSQPIKLYRLWQFCFKFHQRTRNSLNRFFKNKKCRNLKSPGTDSWQVCSQIKTLFERFKVRENVSICLSFLGWCFKHFFLSSICFWRVSA